MIAIVLAAVGLGAACGIGALAIRQRRQAQYITYFHDQP